MGRFLELSLRSDDVLESIAFYELLGFRQTPVGDVWQHPYAVLTDGVICIGLHRYEFDSPALTFVRPDLATALAGLRSRGIQPGFAKLAADEFNEAGFVTPDGQMIALLEARTFSPSVFEPSPSVCGDFEAIALPSRSLEAAEAFWSVLGLRAVEAPDPQRLRLAGAGVRLELRPGPARGLPALLFRPTRDAAPHLHALRSAGLEPRRRGDRVWLETPEGLCLELLQASSGP